MRNIVARTIRKCRTIMRKQDLETLERFTGRASYEDMLKAIDHNDG